MVGWLALALVREWAVERRCKRLFFVRSGWVGLPVGWKGLLESLKVWEEGLEGRFGRKRGGGMIWVGGEKMWNFLD